MTREDVFPKKAIRVTLEGRVQGVGFRYWTLRQASRFDITGWVRNEPDGSVAVECEGPKADVDGFLALLKKGPPGARVDRADVTAFPPQGKYKTFTVAY